MTSSELVLLDKLSPKSVSIGKVKDNRIGMGKSANLSYDNKRFNIAMADIRFPFGASSKPVEYRKGDKDQWTLQCELTEHQIEVMKELDDHVLDTCLQNEEVMAALKLTGKQRCREVLESKYWSSLKYSKDKDGNVKDQYPPTIRINIPNDNADGFTCQFFRSSPEGSQLVKVDNIPESDENIANHLPPDSRGSVLVGISLWISSSGFGLTLRLNQIKTEPRKQLARGVCLLDTLLNSGNADSGYRAIEDPEHLSEEEAESEREVDEIDEIGEQLEESEPEPEPEPKPELKKKAPPVKRVAGKAKATN
jgi:hypothetical protein